MLEPVRCSRSTGSLTVFRLLDDTPVPSGVIGRKKPVNMLDSVFWGTESFSIAPLVGASAGCWIALAVPSPSLSALSSRVLASLVSVFLPLLLWPSGCRNHSSGIQNLNVRFAFSVKGLAAYGKARVSYRTESCGKIDDSLRKVSSQLQ